MSKLISLLIAGLCFWLILTYLIPMLPSPINTIALVIVVIAGILYLARLGGFKIG